jgi:hypothetical protein
VTDGGREERVPLREISDGVCWYFEDESKVRHEGRIEVHHGWVRLGDGLSIPTWIPRENVQQVMER